MRNNPLSLGASLAFAIFLAFTTQANAFQSGYDKGGICFYEKANFKGRKFCAKSGEKISQLVAPWNKAFSSLQLDGSVLVYVCNKPYFGGKCRFYNNSQARFDKAWDDNIASIQIGFKNNKQNIGTKKGENNSELELARRGIRPIKERKITPEPKDDYFVKEVQQEIEKKQEKSDDKPRKEEKKIAKKPDPKPKPITPEKKVRQERKVEAEGEDEGVRTPLPERDRRYARRTDRSEDEYPRSRGDGDSERDNEEASENEDDEVKEEVCFYERAKYRGRSMCVTSNKKLEQLLGRWNDNISSIRVTGAVKIKICADHFYGGECETYRSSKRFVGWHWNDRISSVRVKFLNAPRRRNEKRRAKPLPFSEVWGDMRRNRFNNKGGKACFYQEKNFEGKKFCVPSGTSVSLDEEWNDNIASLTVSGNAKVRVCEHSNLEGYCRTFYRDKRSLGFAWNGVVSSVKVLKAEKRY